MLDVGGMLKTMRVIAAIPFLMLGFLVSGSAGLVVDGTGKVKLKGAKEKSKPTRGLEIDGKFYPAQGDNALFRFYGAKVGIAVEGVEGLINPVAVEVLHQKRAVESGRVDEEFLEGTGTTVEDLRPPEPSVIARLVDAIAERIRGSSTSSESVEAVETDGGAEVRIDRPAAPVETTNGDSVETVLGLDDDERLVGAPEDGKNPGDYQETLVDKVPVRDRFLVDASIIRSYSPFNMMDGSGFQMSTHYARESMAKHAASNPWVQSAYSIVLLLIGWYMGGKSGGGGGGGGGGGLPIPTLVPADVLGVVPTVLDVARLLGGL